MVLRPEPTARPRQDRRSSLRRSVSQGDVRVVPTEQGGGWAVGPRGLQRRGADASAPTECTAGTSAARRGSTVGFACGSGVATVSGEVAARRRSGTSTSTAAPADPTVDTAAPDVPTSEPVASARVRRHRRLPSACRRRTRRSPRPSSCSPTGATTSTRTSSTTSYADEYGASVNAYLVLDGMTAPVILSVGFGENAAVTYASGYLAVPQRGADYPTIGHGRRSRAAEEAAEPVHRTLATSRGIERHGITGHRRARHRGPAMCSGGLRRPTPMRSGRQHPAGHHPPEPASRPTSP